MIKFSYEPDHQKLLFVLDTETLSLEPNAAVIDIAIVPVNSNWSFSEQIKPSSYEGKAAGKFHLSPATLEFHKEKNPAFLNLCEQRGVSVETAAMGVFNFLEEVQQVEKKQVVLMCQGTDFDIPILKNLLYQAGLLIPWHYRNVRDLRSLQALTPEVEYDKGGHTALDDARHSLVHLLKQAEASPLFNNYLYGPGL